MSAYADVEIMRIGSPVHLSNIEIEELLIGLAQRIVQWEQVVAWEAPLSGGKIFEQIERVVHFLDQSNHPELEKERERVS